MIAYLIGWSLSSMLHGWKWMVGLGALPASVQLGLFLFLPESPRWLTKGGQQGVARKTLLKVYGIGSETLVERLLRSIEKDIMEEEEATNVRRLQGLQPKNISPSLLELQGRWSDLVGIPSNRRALIIACMLQGLQQFCGFVGPPQDFMMDLANKSSITPLCTFPPQSLHWLASTHRLWPLCPLQ